jgi:hypothetical protein
LTLAIAEYLTGRLSALRARDLSPLQILPLHDHRC